MKMDKQFVKFDDTEIKEYQFHDNENPILINDIDINKIVVSNELCFGKKDLYYFIGYKDAAKIRLPCIFHPKKRDFDKTRWMYIVWIPPLEGGI